MDREKLLELLRSLPFDRGEYRVGGGGAMVLHGLRDRTPDLDLGCSETLAERLEAEGIPCRRTEDGKRAFRYGDSVEIFESWGPDCAVILDGFPVVSLDGLLEMKRALGREKDLRDIELILAALGGEA